MEDPIERAIRQFRWGNYGMDDVGEAAEDWIPALATAIREELEFDVELARRYLKTGGREPNAEERAALRRHFGLQQGD